MARDAFFRWFQFLEEGRVINRKQQAIGRRMNEQAWARKGVGHMGLQGNGSYPALSMSMPRERT